ncbi:unnamed protein product, partial [Closterium sp. NIES-53]
DGVAAIVAVHHTHLRTLRHRWHTPLHRSVPPCTHQRRCCYRPLRCGHYPHLHVLPCAPCQQHVPPRIPQLQLQKRRELREELEGEVGEEEGEAERVRVAGSKEEEEEEEGEEGADEAAEEAEEEVGEGGGFWRLMVCWARMRERVGE